MMQWYNYVICAIPLGLLGLSATVYLLTKVSRRLDMPDSDGETM